MHIFVVVLQSGTVGIVVHSPQAPKVGIKGQEQLAVSQYATMLGISVEIIPLYTAALVERVG